MTKESDAWLSELFSQMREGFTTIPGIGRIEISKEKPLPAAYRPLQKRDERQNFWMNQNAWLGNAYGQVYLPRAVLEVGQALFPEDWTGYEPSVDLQLRHLPIGSYGVPPWEQRQALDFVEGAARQPGDWQHSVKGTDWLKAVALRKEVMDLIEAPRKRLADTKSLLIQHLLEGKLPYVTLMEAIGQFTQPHLPNYWFTPKTDARFYFCRMNPNTPISDAVAGAGFQPIFVDQKALSAIVSSLATGKKNTPADCKALRQFLTEAVSASPQVRALETNKDIWPWIKANAPTITDRKYNEIRKQVLAKFPGNKWGQ